MKKFKVAGEVGEDLAIVSRFEKEEGEVAAFVEESKADGWMESTEAEWEAQMKAAEVAPVEAPEVVAE